MKWTLSNSGDLVLTPSDSEVLRCTSLHAKAVGNVATVDAIFCPRVGDSTLMVQDFVKSGGTVTLEGNNLRVALGLGSNLTYASGSKAQCNGPLSGVLIRP